VDTHALLYFEIIQIGVLHPQPINQAPTWLRGVFLQHCRVFIMAPIIYVMRHAPVGNIDTNTRDPGLSPEGIQAAQGIDSAFPHSASIAIIITSPLRRALQTVNAAFSKHIDIEYAGPNGIENGAEVIVDPKLQETPDDPPNTGSDASILKAEFPYLDFSHLSEEWHKKEGQFSPQQSVVRSRVRIAREDLLRIAERLSATNNDGGERTNILVVTHSGIAPILTGDSQLFLKNLEWRSYTIGRDVNGAARLRRSAASQ
jgi:broad specificity phosphatase PhoE